MKDRHKSDHEIDAKNGTINGPTMTRRSLLKAGAGAAGIGAASTALPGRYSPTQNAEAIAPLVLGAAAVGTSAAVGWALREYEVLGSDDPPQGLTADALIDNIYGTIKKRKSNNQSTFVDNRNILDGMKFTAYSEGKIAAIEALNNGKTQDQVLAATQSAVDNYASTIKANYLKGWNESTLELDNILQSVNDHPDLSASNLFTQYNKEDDAYSGTIPDPLYQNSDITLPDGTTFTVKAILEQGNPYHPGISSTPWNGYDAWVLESTTNTDEIMYLEYGQWRDVFLDIETTFSNVHNGLSTWVDNVYGQVQAGELDTSDLLSPIEIASMTADDQEFNQAVADLMALNISTNLEREAEIYLPEIDATLWGQLATTGDGTISTGTIDPSADSQSYYFTYDVSEGTGTWSAYNTGVDGGVITFTQEPWPESVYRITTTAGETIEVPTADWTADTDGSGNTIWTYDASADLETAITEIESVEYYATVEETQYETIQLTSEFEIKSFSDPEGNEYSEITVESNEPQDDTNYITEDEWQAMQDRQEELIDKYEDSQDTGGISLPWSDSPITWIMNNPGLSIVGGAAAIGTLLSLSSGSS